MGASNGASGVTIRRVTGTTTDADGYVVPVWSAIYAGPARLGGADRGGSGSTTRKVGDVETTVATRTAHLPADTTGIADGDLIEITAGENVGATFRIVEATWQDGATARRVPVVQTERPIEWGA
jgi:hypothetical protein